MYYIIIKVIFESLYLHVIYKFNINFIHLILQNITIISLKLILFYFFIYKIFKVAFNII